MIPWNKLPQEAQKSLLVFIVLSSGASLAGCREPTPIICDPAPPPSVMPPATPTPLVAGEPTAAPPTVNLATSTFRVINLQIVADPNVPFAAVRGRVVNQNGAPAPN